MLLRSLVATLVISGLTIAQDNTYFNPVLPGWHSDPSCTQVDGTYFCVTSTFIAFPGLPVYASKDLINWKLTGHAWNREDQIPGVSWETKRQQGGMYAATIRHHDGKFYVICEYLGDDGINGVIFTTSDPFNNDWSVPVTFSPPNIDPDLFWDDDGTVWMATAGINIQKINIDSGELGEPTAIWEGTGGASPEGPHIYKKNGYYYLLIAEGGTFGNHAITIARSENITGPYEAYENNPILTNRGTDEYFQAIGHGDLFQDPDSNWWGLCLGIRTGDDDSQPMGREAFLFNATWNDGEWPSLQPVRGEMPGDLLPHKNIDSRGSGPFNQANDDYAFDSRSTIPPHFVYWRVPRENVFSMVDDGFKIVPSRNNQTGVPESSDHIALTGQRGMSFIGRRQAHSLFSFGVDMSFNPQADNQEAGVSVFRTQLDHIDFGVVRQESTLLFRLRAEGPDGAPIPEPHEVPMPEGWDGGNIRLQIDAKNSTHYEFSSYPSDDPGASILIGTASALIVSGGNGTFVGSLLGVYVTCNGDGEGTSCPGGGEAYIAKWSYGGVSQQYDHDSYYP